MMRNGLMTLAIMLSMAVVAYGAAGKDGHAADGSHAEAAGEHHVSGPHPTLSPREETTWAGALVIIVIGMFVAAAAVGVVVRANAPDEVPQDSHHDDGHGHNDPHHGASGHHH